MPAKGKTKVTSRQRKKIAAGRLVGKTDKAIAAEVGLHPVTVNRVAHDARTTTLILRLKEKDDQDFATLWASMITGLKDDIASKDFSERHASRNFLLKAITAGDPPLHRVGDVGSSEGDFTLEELLLTMRRVTKKKAG